jgi:hypothetical protein
MRWQIPDRTVLGGVSGISTIPFENRWEMHRMSLPDFKK